MRDLRGSLHRISSNRLNERIDSSDERSELQGDSDVRVSVVVLNICFFMVVVSSITEREEAVA